jgi:hypothetical protein
MRPLTEENVMIKQIKNMDPMTKMFAKAAAVHVAVIVTMSAIVVYNAKHKND